MKRLLEDKNYVKQALTYKIFVCKKDFAEFTGRLGFVLSSYDSRLLHTAQWVSILFKVVAFLFLFTIYF